MYFVDILVPSDGFVLSEIRQTPSEEIRGSVFALPLNSKHVYFLRQNLKDFPEEWKGMHFKAMVICVHEENEVEVTEVKVDSGFLMWFMHKKDERIKETLKLMAEHGLWADHFCKILHILHPRSPIAVMYSTFIRVYGGAIEEVNEHTNRVKSL